MRKRTKDYRHLLLTMLLLVITSHVFAQAKPLKTGEINTDGISYDIRIRDESNHIYISDLSVYKKIRLFDSYPDAEFLYADFINFNKKDLLTIKRKYFAQNSGVDIAVSMTKEGKLLGLEYSLPKSSRITEDLFIAFDRQIRKELKIEIIFPTERYKNKRYNGWATKTVVLY